MAPLRPEEAHRAYEHGYAGTEEPFTPERLCRRLTGLLASPRAIGEMSGPYPLSDEAIDEALKRTSTEGVVA